MAWIFIPGIKPNLNPNLLRLRSHIKLSVHGAVECDVDEGVSRSMFYFNKYVRDYDAARSFENWFFGAVVKQAIRDLRRLVNGRSQAFSIDTEEADYSVTKAVAKAALDQEVGDNNSEETMEKLETLIDKLSLQQARVVRYRKEGKSDSEISALEDTTLTNVRQIHSRAVKRLIELVAEEGLSA